MVDTCDPGMRFQSTTEQVANGHDAIKAMIPVYSNIDRSRTGLAADRIAQASFAATNGILGDIHLIPVDTGSMTDPSPVQQASSSAAGAIASSDALSAGTAATVEVPDDVSAVRGGLNMATGANATGVGSVATPAARNATSMVVLTILAASDDDGRDRNGADIQCSRRMTVRFPAFGRSNMVSMGGAAGEAPRRAEPGASGRRIASGFGRSGFRA